MFWDLAIRTERASLRMQKISNGRANSTSQQGTYKMHAKIFATNLVPSYIYHIISILIYFIYKIFIIPSENTGGTTIRHAGGKTTTWLTFWHRTWQFCWLYKEIKVCHSMLLNMSVKIKNVFQSWFIQYDIAKERWSVSRKGKLICNVSKQQIARFRHKRE